jgi:hypothetical protein
MQNSDETEASFKSPLRIFCKGLQGFVDSGKQDIESGFFVGQNNGIEGMWQG